jgi:hypothetical protein
MGRRLSKAVIALELLLLAYPTFVGLLMVGGAFVPSNYRSTYRRRLHRRGNCEGPALDESYGREVVAWNRSSDKLAALAANGATAAASPAEVMTRADLIGLFESLSTEASI